MGAGLTKSVYVDGVILGETAQNTFFYKEILPGKHEVETESEFSNNSITFQAEGGRNYFIKQYIKLGVFIGGAGLTLVTEENGMEEVRGCKLAQ